MLCLQLQTFWDSDTQARAEPLHSILYFPSSVPHLSNQYKNIYLCCTRGPYSFAKIQFDSSQLSLMCSFFSDANPLLSGESNYHYHNSQHQPSCIRLDLLHMQKRAVGINDILYFTNQLLLYTHPSSKPHNFDMNFLQFFEAEVTSK